MVKGDLYMSQYYIEPKQARFAEDYELEEGFCRILLDEIIKLIKNESYSGDLADAAGLVIKSDTHSLLVDDYDHNSIVIGSTGCGKTRKVGLLYALTCALKGENLILNDVKGELWHFLSGLLEHLGYKIEILNFREPMKGGRYNLLEFPAKLYKKGKVDRAYDLFWRISNTIFEAVESDKDPFWHLVSAGYFVSLCIVACEICEDYKNVTFKMISDIHHQGTESFGASTILHEYFTEDRKGMLAWKYASEAINAPKETRASIYSVFETTINRFIMSEEINDMSYNSTFQIERLLDEKQAVFIINPDETSVYDNIVSAMIDQWYSELTYLASTSSEGCLPTRVEFILDEFSNMAPIKDMDRVISSSRSRGIRFLLMIQSLEQLSIVYGDKMAQILISNCINVVYLYSPDIKLAQMLSDRCGKVVDDLGSGHSYMQSRPLISPETLQHLDREKGECLLLLGQHYPYVSCLPDISEYDIPFISMPVCLKKRKKQTLIKCMLADMVRKEKRNRLSMHFNDDRDYKKEKGKEERTKDEKQMIIKVNEVLVNKVFMYDY